MDNSSGVNSVTLENRVLDLQAAFDESEDRFEKLLSLLSSRLHKLDEELREV
jgi:hypothetical protein